MLTQLIILVGTLLFFFLADFIFGSTFLSASIKSVVLVIAGPLLAYRLSTIKSLWRELLRIFAEQAARDGALVTEIARVAYVWQVEGYRGLENELHKIKDPFLRTGIELLADSCEPEEIKTILNRQSQLSLAARSAEGNILAVLAKRANSFGLIGTVIGIIMVLGSIGDSAAMGNGIAMALLSTLYGLLLANLVYLPLHNKFKASLRMEHRSHLLVMDGVNYLALGKCSRSIAYRLRSFLAGEEKTVPPKEMIMSVSQHRLNAEGAMVQG